jgi:Cytochrome c7 and related cytochrome c
LRRLPFLIFAALLVGAYFFFDILPRLLPAPRAQPMRFSHAAHFDEAECGACHLYATEDYAAGVPTLSDCLDCHEGTQSKDPEGEKEEAKLQKYIKASHEIPWKRLPRLPPHVFFPHVRHTTVGEIECSTCHGGIAKTKTIPDHPPYKFRMGWCINCHHEKEASTDCISCHR